MDEERMGRREHLSRISEFEGVKSVQRTQRLHIPVKRVLDAVDCFYGARDESGGEQVPFAKEVAIYLLKSDFSMCFEFISRGLELDYNKVMRSYHKIHHMAEMSPDFKQGLDRIRRQYNHEGPA